MALFVLVHSPSVGPSTWSPVAQRLRAADQAVAVPSLLAVGEGGPPFWPRVVAAVDAGLAGTGPGEPLVLVAHSNAGAFLPVIAHGLGRPVACAIFADALLPAAHGHTSLADEDVFAFLRSLAGPDGLLPRWTDWFDEQDVAPMFPGPASRETITREQPRLPLDYYREQVPVPPGWDDSFPCGYLLFSQGYEADAAEAGRRGWALRRVPGEHLHQVVDPAGVTGALLGLAGAARV